MQGDEGLAGEAGLPWPHGDADGLRRAARSFAGAARASAAVAARVGHERAAGAGWTGGAAGRYEASVTAESAALRRTADGLADGAGSLERLAGVLDDAQQEVARWAARVVELQDRARAAHAAIPTLLSTMESWGRTELLPELAAGRRAAAAAGRLDGELAALRAKAEARAEAACSRVDAADRSCAADLSALAATAPLPGAIPASPPATPLGMAVAGAFAPVYHFDGGEEHFMDDVRYYVAHSDLKRRDDGEQYYDPRGEAIRNGNQRRATLPAAYRVTADGDLQMEYGAFYPFNDFPNAPSVHVLGIHGFFSHIDHEGDFETLTVQFQGGRPARVDYKAHGKAGVVPWARAVGGDRSGRPQDYPARGGHGNHPTTDRYDSNFTAGWPVSELPHLVTQPWRDDPGTKGGTWDSAPNLLDARSVPALRGQAHFGEDAGKDNPKSFLAQKPTEDADTAPPHGAPQSIWTHWERLLLVL
ncbi:MAG TPA: hypothetical protein VFJ85_09295 [Acidimicrobiales bacterium]|nr:hypothetical protein [Acidimicrobiales bacterium]